MDYRQLQARIHEVQSAEILEEMRGYTVDRVPDGMEASLSGVLLHFSRQRDGELELLVKIPGEAWKPYQESHLAQPDGSALLATPGMRTLQYCVKRGAKVINDREYLHSLITAVALNVLALPGALILDVWTIARRAIGGRHRG